MLNKLILVLLLTTLLSIVRADADTDYANSVTNGVIVEEEAAVPILLDDSAFDSPVPYKLYEYVMLNYTTLSVQDIKYLYENYKVLTVEQLTYDTVLLTTLDYRAYKFLLTLILNDLPFATLNDIDPSTYQTVLFNYLQQHEGTLKYSVFITAVLMFSEFNLPDQQYNQLLANILSLNGITYDTSYSDFIIVADELFKEAANRWKKKFDIILDYVTLTQMHVVPHPITSLGRRRKDVIIRLAKPVLTAEDEAVIREYFKDLAIALNRSDTLNKKRYK